MSSYDSDFKTDPTLDSYETDSFSSGISGFEMPKYDDIELAPKKKTKAGKKKRKAKVHKKLEDEEDELTAPEP